MAVFGGETDTKILDLILWQVVVIETKQVKEIANTEYT